MPGSQKVTRICVGITKRLRQKLSRELVTNERLQLCTLLQDLFATLLSLTVQVCIFAGARGSVAQV